MKTTERAITVRVDEKILQGLKIYCVTKGMKQKEVVEKLIKDFIKGK